jgi:NTP pyrophosphatase (non-canonical NTP hydrolase)
MIGPAIDAVKEFLVAKNIDVSIPFSELTPTNDMPQLLAIMKQHAEYALRRHRELGNTPWGIRYLALSLVIEETQELIAAVLMANETETMDAIGDTLYVAIGLALRLQLPANAAFIAVHESNMTKAPGSPDQPRLDGEKKGESYVAPDFTRSVEELT